MIKIRGSNRGNAFMRQELAQAIKHWAYLAPVVKQPHNRKEYQALVASLDELLDLVGDDENHHLMGLVDIISQLIAAYESTQVEKIKGRGVDALKYFMEAHGLKQTDLAAIGSQGVVSEILHGKRALNLRQIKWLAKRFHVDPATFIDD